MTALQTSAAHNVATPANQVSGERVIVPAPKTAEGAAARVSEEGVECRDWYFCKTAL